MNSEKLRRKEFGKLAEVIGRRLDDLAGIDTLDRVSELPGNFEALTGNRSGQYSMRLGRNHRLIFEPATHPLPTKRDGGTDLAKVTAIRIIEVVDYHRG